MKTRDFAAWKALYYPLPASEVQFSRTDLLVLHSYMKWRGVRKKVLERYGMRTFYSGTVICDATGTQVMHLDNSTCALCLRFLKQNTSNLGYRCDGCPLLEVTGNKCGEPESAWLYWCDNHEPEPMIKALWKAYWRVQKNELKKWFKKVFNKIKCPDCFRLPDEVRCD